MKLVFLVHCLFHGHCLRFTFVSQLRPIVHGHSHVFRGLSRVFYGYCTLFHCHSWPHEKNEIVRQAVPFKARLHEARFRGGQDRPSAGCEGRRTPSCQRWRIHFAPRNRFGVPGGSMKIVRPIWSDPMSSFPAGPLVLSHQHIQPTTTYAQSGQTCVVILAGASSSVPASEVNGQTASSWPASVHAVATGSLGGAPASWDLWDQIACHHSRRARGCFRKHPNWIILGELACGSFRRRFYHSLALRFSEPRPLFRRAARAFLFPACSFFAAGPDTGWKGRFPTKLVRCRRCVTIIRLQPSCGTSGLPPPADGYVGSLGWCCSVNDHDIFKNEPGNPAPDFNSGEVCV